MEPIPETVRAAEELGPFAADGDLLDELRDMARRVEAIVPECVGLSVTSREHGVTFTLVATALEIAILDAMQYLASGPCVASLEEERIVAVPDPDPLDEDTWRYYARASGQTGIASSLSLPVLKDGQAVGSVNLYGASPDSFVSHHAELAEIFGAWAPGAVHDADLSFQTRFEAQDAPRRLTQGSVLDRAVDVVARLGIHGPDQARERIRLAARRAGIGELQLAEALLKLPAE